MGVCVNGEVEREVLRARGAGSRAQRLPQLLLKPTLHRRCPGYIVSSDLSSNLLSIIPSSFRISRTILRLKAKVEGPCLFPSLPPSLFLPSSAA